MSAHLDKISYLLQRHLCRHPIRFGQAFEGFLAGQAREADGGPPGDALVVARGLLLLPLSRHRRAHPDLRPGEEYQGAVLVLLACMESAATLCICGWGERHGRLESFEVGDPAELVSGPSCSAALSTISAREKNTGVEWRFFLLVSKFMG